MSIQVLVLVMVAVGTASVFWFARRQPSRQQTIAAIATCVGSIYTLAVPRFQGTLWFDVAAVTATIAVTFLLTLWMRPRTPHQIG